MEWNVLCKIAYQIVKWFHISLNQISSYQLPTPLYVLTSITVHMAALICDVYEPWIIILKTLHFGFCIPRNLKMRVTNEKKGI